MRKSAANVLVLLINRRRITLKKLKKTENQVNSVKVKSAKMVPKYKACKLFNKQQKAVPPKSKESKQDHKDLLKLLKKQTKRIKKKEVKNYEV